MQADAQAIVANIKSHLFNFLREKNLDSKILESSEVLFNEKNAEILKHLPEIQQTLDLWHDQASLEQYINFLTFSMLSKLDYKLALQHDHNMTQDQLKEISEHMQEIVESNGLTIPKLEAKEEIRDEIGKVLCCTFAVQQYKYPDWVDVTPGEIFVDCGAYIGDTAVWACQKGARVYSFDPINSNIEALKHNLALNGFSTDNCYNVAVGSSNKPMVINVPKNHKSGAFMSQEKMSYACELFVNQFELEQVRVNCIRMDDFFKSTKVVPDFIKMDIEGSELDALKGTAETIKQHKPKLAICLYHSDSDLWTIPLYINSLVPDYKFFCKENTCGGEFVMYATVQAKAE